VAVSSAFEVICAAIYRNLGTLRNFRREIARAETQRRRDAGKISVLLSATSRPSAVEIPPVLFHSKFARYNVGIGKKCMTVERSKQHRNFAVLLRFFVAIPLRKHGIETIS
jgi:hypothetical protein